MPCNPRPVWMTIMIDVMEVDQAQRGKAWGRRGKGEKRRILEMHTERMMNFHRLYLYQEIVILNCNNQLDVLPPYSIS
jgi:hypothetical protein